MFFLAIAPCIRPSFSIGQSPVTTNRRLARRDRYGNARLVPSRGGALGSFFGLDLLTSGSVTKHALCTEYDVGAGIGWHRDKKHFDQVFGLSLASACNFRFRRKAGNKWERFTLNAQPRSLYVMTGASRHIWEHSIPPVETPRYSITFRTMAQA